MFHKPLDRQMNVLVIRSHRELHTAESLLTEPFGRFA